MGKLTSTYRGCQWLARALRYQHLGLYDIVRFGLSELYIWGNLYPFQPNADRHVVSMLLAPAKSRVIQLTELNNLERGLTIPMVNTLSLFAICWCLVQFPLKQLNSLSRCVAVAVYLPHRRAYTWKSWSSGSESSSYQGIQVACLQLGTVTWIRRSTYLRNWSAIIRESIL